MDVSKSWNILLLFIHNTYFSTVIVVISHINDVPEFERILSTLTIHPYNNSSYISRFAHFFINIFDDRQFSAPGRLFSLLVYLR